MSEEINKIFHRIELDKTNDSCGFEFADGFNCTFDNIATCYDDRLKLYELVKQLQQENQQLKEGLKEQYEKIRSLDISCAIKEKDLCFYEQQLDLYKSVLDEIREYIKENYNLNWYVESCYKDDLLQILDKENKNEKEN